MMDNATLISMARQIAQNFAAQGEQEAVEATAQHMIDFWDPRMLAGIAQATRTSMPPIVLAAVDRIRETEQLGMLQPDPTRACWQTGG